MGPLLKVWEISASEMSFGEKLGEGGQATVVKGKWNGIEVAIKQPKAPKASSKKNMGMTSSTALDSFAQAVRREVRALSRVRHPNVVRLYGACFDPTPMVLMAYAPTGTLQDALDENKFGSNAEVVRLFAGIARGMQAVHAHNLIHLDLKPENVLIGPMDVPWLTDFGLSTSANMTSMSQSSAGGRGTLPFKAPELFTHPPVISQAADVYAYAVLAWTVVAGEQPYATFVSAATALPAAVCDGTRPALADGEDWKDRTTGQLAKLIEACWEGEHENRPSFGTAGGEDKGIVAILEKLETSMTKGSDEASQVAMVTRLYAAEAEAEEAHEYLAQIDDGIADKKTTASEAKELKEEREGVEVSAKVVRQNAFTAREQITKASGGDELVSTLLNVMMELSNGMRELKNGVVDKIKSHEMSLDSLTTGELECPRLFVLLPLEKEGSRMMQLISGLNPKNFVQDRYRLVFLDPITGYATPCGPEGDGYRVELTKSWIVENRRYINDGMKAEAQAVQNFEMLMGGDMGGGDVDAAGAANSQKGGAKAATGAAYKMLRKLLKDQCNDEYLVHCMLKKARASDGTIEFVTDESHDKFIAQGASALIWNNMPDPIPPAPVGYIGGDKFGKGGTAALGAAATVATVAATEVANTPVAVVVAEEVAKAVDGAQ